MRIVRVPLRTLVEVEMPMTLRAVVEE